MNFKISAVLAGFALASGLGCASAHEVKDRPAVNNPNATSAEGELVKVGTSLISVMPEGADEARDFRRTPKTKLLDENGNEAKWDELEEGALVRVSFDVGLNRETAREVKIVDKDGIREGTQGLRDRIREDLRGAGEDLKTKPEEVMGEIEKDAGVTEEEVHRDVSDWSGGKTTDTEAMDKDELNKKAKDTREDVQRGAKDTREDVQREAKDTREEAQKDAKDAREDLQDDDDELGE